MNDNFIQYNEARVKLASFKLKTRKDWQKLIGGENHKGLTLPEGIPEDPETYYKDRGWKSWNDFFSVYRKN